MRKTHSHFGKLLATGLALLFALGIAGGLFAPAALAAGQEQSASVTEPASDADGQPAQPAPTPQSGSDGGEQAAEEVRPGQQEAPPHQQEDQPAPEDESAPVDDADDPELEEEEAQSALRAAGGSLVQPVNDTLTTFATDEDVYTFIQAEINAAVSAGLAETTITLDLDESITTLTFTKMLSVKRLAADPYPAGGLTINFVSTHPITIQNGTTRHINLDVGTGQATTLRFENITLDGMGVKGGIRAVYKTPHLTLINAHITNCSTSSSGPVSDWWVAGAAVAVQDTAASYNDRAQHTGSLTVLGGSFTGTQPNNEGEYFPIAVAATLLDSFTMRDAVLTGNLNIAAQAHMVTNVDISGCTFEDNVISGSEGASLSLAGCTYIKVQGSFTNNAAHHGAAIAITIPVNAPGTTKTVEIYDSHFENNHGDTTTFKNGMGGAVFIQGTSGSGSVTGEPYNIGSAVIRGCTFAGNSAYAGGALMVYSRGTRNGSVSVENCNFTQNRATSAFYNTMGGAAYLDATTVSVSGCGFSGNLSLSTLDGGASTGGSLHIPGGVGAATISSSTFAGGSATYGGAIMSYSPLSLTGGSVTDNTALYGGGLYVVKSSNYSAIVNLAVDGTTFFRNTSPEGWGGAIYTAATGTVSITGTAQFTNNYAAGGGGAVCFFLTGEEPADTLDRLHVGPGVVFSKNAAEEGYFLAEDDANRALHIARIQSSAFSAPFVFAYNNYDIFYLSGRLYAAAEVRYHAMDGDYTPPTQSLMTGQTVDAPTRQPQLVGHSFAGWYTQPSGGARWDFAAKLWEQELDLYARYSRNSYQVTYVYSNGHNANLVRQVPYQSSLQKPDDPTREGYSFLGWFDEGGALWDFATPMPAYNIILTAGWQAIATSGTTSVSPSVPPVVSSSPVPSTAPPPPATESSSAPAGSTSRRPVSSTAPVTPSSSSAAPLPQSSSAPPVSVPAVSSTVPAPQPVASVPESRPGLFAFSGDGLPLGGFTSVGGWSLFNLLIALLALASGVVRLVLVLARRRRTPQRGEEHLEGLVRAGSAPGPVTWLAILTGALPLLAFLVLENLRSTAVVFNAFSSVFILLALAHGILALLAARRQKNRG